jgi:CheY-like chemotaxis protein
MGEFISEQETGGMATVLVVEDDADTRAALRELLDDQGYAVVALEDGQKAFDYLDQHPTPDAVVLDLWMPVRDGWSLATEVLVGRLPMVPIIVVTAGSNSTRYAYPVPPRYVLRKPVDPDRLLGLVKEVVEARGPIGVID